MIKKPIPNPTPMDRLSAVLPSFRLEGAVFLDDAGKEFLLVTSQGSSFTVEEEGFKLQLDLEFGDTCPHSMAVRIQRITDQLDNLRFFCKGTLASMRETPSGHPDVEHDDPWGGQL